MKRRWAAGLLAAGVLVKGAGAAGVAAPDPAVDAWIAAAPQEPATFVGYARAAPDFVGRYELLAERQGASGTSRVRQAGAIRGRGEEALRLSQVSLGKIAAGDRIVVTLTIFGGDGDKPLAVRELRN